MAKMLIGGESCDSVTGKTTEVRNPATGATVDTVPLGNDKDVQQAIQAADDAFKVWSDVTPEDRGNALLNAGELIKKNSGEIAQLLTQEQGKTLFEAGLEIHHLCTAWSSTPASLQKCAAPTFRCRRRMPTAWSCASPSVFAAALCRGIFH